MQLCGVSRPEAIKHTAAVVGQSAEFHEPDFKAEAVHRYRNRSGKVIKEVLRFRDPVTGEKRFSQRRPVKGGHIPNAKGVESYLYRLDELQHACTVCITEGEGDADMVHSLNLFDIEGKHIVGTTTGGAETWKDRHADEFLGKRVIVMPDDDEAGRRYEAQILESLQRRGIESRVVRFGDVGAKDVTGFLADHSVTELLARLPADWVLRDEAQTFEPMQGEAPVLTY
jgi:hypothetical protein